MNTEALTVEQTAELEAITRKAETGEQWAEVCRREAEMLGQSRQIVTHYDPKPIPLRQFDWVATFDDYDGAPIDEDTASPCPIGYGRTEAEAVADLHEAA